MQQPTFRALNLPFDETAVDHDLPGATDATPDAAFGSLISQILNIALIAGVIAVLFFLILGAFEWLTAGGDASKVTKAREKMTNAVIGLVVLVSVVAIMMFVQTLLNICIINFGTNCRTSENVGRVVTPPPRLDRFNPI